MIDGRVTARRSGASTFFQAQLIQHIPTLLIYRDGILLYRKAGSPKAEVLEDLIDQVEKLDMDVVRTDVAAKRAAKQKATGGEGAGA